MTKMIIIAITRMIILAITLKSNKLTQEKVSQILGPKPTTRVENVRIADFVYIQIISALTALNILLLNLE